MSEKQFLIQVNNKRYPFLDVAKAIGIYLVILGHLVLFNWKTFRFIFAFHMPLFFVVAGFVLYGKELPKFGPFLKKQARYYLVPLGVVFLLGILQCLIIPMNGHNLQTILSQDMLKDLYEGHFRFSFFGSSWFLLCMFFAQVFFYGMRRLSKLKKRYINVLVWILAVLLAVYAPDIFIIIPQYRRLPLKLDSALMAMVFMGVGYLASLAYHGCKMDERKPVIRMLIGLGLVLTGIPVVYFVSCKGNTYVNLCDAVYARPERYLIGSISGSLMVIGASILLEKSRALQYIGRNTLVIFLSHSVFITLVVSLVNRIFHLELVPQYMKFDLVCITLSIIVLGLSTATAALFRLGKKAIRKGKRSK